MPSSPKPVLSSTAVQRALTRIAHQIAEHNPNANDVVVIGIQTGGAHLAKRIANCLGEIYKVQVPSGLVDVSMHRDDFNQRIASPMHPTIIPFDITGKLVILVDDVLFSGRTTRAAMDTLNDFGRPKAIQLAVLIDRGNRQLPIKADYVGKEVPTSQEEHIDVRLKEVQGEDAVYLKKT